MDTLPPELAKQEESMSNQVVMTNGHPQWSEFIGRLSRVAGQCDSKTLSHSSAILQTMGGFDVEKSLEFFRQHGGYCDCEVLMNVAQ